MIMNSAETRAISNLRWLDAGKVWSYALGEADPRLVQLSEAKWLSLVPGIGEYFGAVHHSEGGDVRLTSHSHDNIAEPISSIDLRFGDGKSAGVSKSIDVKFTGEVSTWLSLPKAYIAHAFGEPHILLVNSGEGVAQIQPLPWYKASYDTMYQGIMSVTEVPGTSLLLISVQRDSEPVLYDAARGTVVQRVKLTERRGNPQLFFRRTARELWATDYDTLVRLEPRNWSVLETLKLQSPLTGMVSSNIGQYYFCRDERLCVVSRPHSGDVVGVDPTNFTVTHRAETGGQPEDVGLFRDNSVVARDLKTGRLLQGALQPA